MLHLLAVLPPSQSPSFTINAWWLFAGGFFTTLGVATWKFLPWVVKQALDEKIDVKLVPMVDEVHKRFDEHMDAEEGASAALNETIVAIRVQLGERDQLFDDLQSTMEQTRDTLARHVEADDHQFQLTAEALSQTQRMLLERLAQIEAKATQGAVPPPSSD